jgi:glycosyltransferase involved in cell wall biosynthesis
MEISETKLPISVCIPTKDRPGELKRCIKSILEQTVLPAEIIIIDDGNLDQTVYIQIIEPFTGFKYFKKGKPSLSASKNITKTLASEDLILILDDDTLLDKEYIQNIYEVFKKDINKEIGIVGGIVINRKKKNWFEKLYRRLFFLDNGKPGLLLPWGFQTGFNGIYEDTLVEWISGGISCFRREVLEEFSFEEFHGGRNVFEDVEFGWKVLKSKNYKIIITPSARLYHFHSPHNRETMLITGFKEGYNRCWIFNKHCEKSFKNLIFFWWATIGFTLGMIGTRRINMAKGYIKGSVSFYRKSYEVR